MPNHDGLVSCDESLGASATPLGDSGCEKSTLTQSWPWQDAGAFLIAAGGYNARSRSLGARMDQEEDERKQREALNKLGVEAVKARMPNVGSGTGAEFPLQVSSVPNPSRGFVEDWLASKEQSKARTTTKRYRVLAFIGLAGVAVSALALCGNG